MQLKEAEEKLSSGFFGFWLKQRRVTILVLIVIILIGTYSAMRIPKESVPEIDLGIVRITTTYPWGNPEDINDLITKKIENEIENINGVKSFDSQSLDSVSSIMVTLENDADSSDVTNKIEDAVKRVSLPSDANDPVVALVDTEAMKQVLFYMNLYAKDDRFDADYLKQKAKLIKEALEGQGYLDTITITDGDQYDIEVLVDQQKLEQFKLPISQISSLIQGFNQNQPLGTHELGDKEYSFRINGEYVSIEELENMFISLGNGQTIPLSSIATIKRTYPENQRYEIGHFENGEDYHGKLAVTILFNKKRSASILEASKQAKEMIEEELKKPEYENLGYFYTSDLGKQISDDYSELAVNMISTLLIVFIIVRCFVGTVESLLATISIPLAFFITFFVLNGMEFSMNMLTNFSLIICLGIAVDSATVIIQGSSENMKKGFKPLHAALLAVKTYKNSLISGTATTVVVFLPLMSLPGMMGKAISYIPITIFITLLASLFISLTVTPAIFFKMNKDKNTYQKDEESESLMDETAKVILDADRQEKTEVTKKEEKSESSSYRDKILDKLVDRYDKKIRKVVENKKSRALRVILPIVILVFTLLFVSTNLGFLMMPADDNEQMGITLKAEAGITEDKIREKAEGYHEVLASIPELENYQASIKGNKISIDLKLVEKSQRDRTSFEVEDELTEKLQFLKERGFEVSISIEGFASQLWGWWGEVGVKIIAKDGVDQTELAKVARDFEKFLREIPGTKNITNSSEESPGQFVFQLDKSKLAKLGLTPSNVGPQLYLALNGMKAGSVTLDGDSHDIKVKYDNFQDEVSPETLMTTLIPTSAGQLPLASLGNYTFKPAVTNISREDGDIVVTLGANLQQGFKAEPVNEALYSYAENYDYPDGISFSKGGEQEENADLIQSVLFSFVFAFIMIFSILVLQFNKYTQPLIICYSILMGFVGATYGTRFVGFPYSLMFMIGFVSLMGIVVNNAIILIDSANENINQGSSRMESIIKSAKFRLKPILSTTLTTVIGMMTLTSNGMFAPLAYTIMYGLTVATIVTLFAVPVLYNDENKLRMLIKRLVLKPLLSAVFIGIIIGIIYLLGLLFSYDFFGDLIGKGIMIATAVATFILLFVLELRGNFKGDSGRRRNFINLELKYPNQNHKKIILKRMFYKYGLLLLPAIGAGILTALVQGLGADELVVSLVTKTALILGYGAYVAFNIYSYRTTEGNQFLHDKWTWVEIIDNKDAEKRI